MTPQQIRDEVEKERRINILETNLDREKFEHMLTKIGMITFIILSIILALIIRSYQ